MITVQSARGHVRCVNHLHALSGALDTVWSYQEELSSGDLHELGVAWVAFDVTEISNFATTEETYAPHICPNTGDSQRELSA